MNQRRRSAGMATESLMVMTLVVTGPVTGGTHDQPFNAMPDQLAERYGYVEEEYVLEGDATARRRDRIGRRCRRARGVALPSRARRCRRGRRPDHTGKRDGTMPS
jgi:hypothetical protein